MKLIKFIATAALVASTFLVSGGNAASTGTTQLIAAPCHNWPFCRDVDIVDQTTEKPQYIAAPCHNWPFCRDVDIMDPVMDQLQQLPTKAVSKAV